MINWMFLQLGQTVHNWREAVMSYTSQKSLSKGEAHAARVLTQAQVFAACYSRHTPFLIAIQCLG